MGHEEHFERTQYPPAQSPAESQGDPLLHPGHAPPQSMPISAPFVTPSLHVGTVQMPASQMSLEQSDEARQVSPGKHLGHAAPPQSTSVSVPFCAPSPHEGGGGSQIPFTQMSLEQSV